VDGERWELLYDLHGDALRVRETQKWSFDRPGFGFPPEPLLFGSDEWWAALNTGEIETREEVGSIAQPVRRDSYGDSAAFEVRSSDGAVTTWPFLGGDERLYVEGLRIRIRYALLERKDDAPIGLDRIAKVVVQIWIESSSEQAAHHRAELVRRRHAHDAASPAQPFSPWDRPADE
jgi:hypothetical protein